MRGPKYQTNPKVETYVDSLKATRKWLSETCEGEGARLISLINLNGYADLVNISFPEEDLIIPPEAKKPRSKRAYYQAIEGFRVWTIKNPVEA